MAHFNIKDKTGEMHSTYEGDRVEIIDYKDAKNCTVKFTDETILYGMQYGHIVRGMIKNPNYKSLFNTGFIGIGNYKVSFKRKVTKLYSNWKGIIERCHSEKYQESHPNYKSCSVDDRWHNYQIFAEWMENNYNPKTMQGWDLDKDILKKGNKIYSPETCCFVPKEINGIFKSSKKQRGELPIGVTTRCNRFIASCMINGRIKHIGTFNTVEQAFQAYKFEKEKEIRRVAEFWKPQLAPQTYQAMINYQVEITD
jgi:hypothetical protein